MSSKRGSSGPRYRAKSPVKRVSKGADARRRVLAAWRGVDEVALEGEKGFSAKSILDLVPGVLKSMGLDRRRSEAEVGRAWNQLIDPVITAHAQPQGLVRGTLFVVVDSHVWLDEIVRYRRREILERLQHCFGSELVQRISFRVG